MEANNKWKVNRSATAAWLLWRYIAARSRFKYMPFYPFPSTHTKYSLFDLQLFWFSFRWLRQSGCTPFECCECERVSGHVIHCHLSIQGSLCIINVLLYWPLVVSHWA